jgi:signal transduction histidine kinase
VGWFTIGFRQALAVTLAIWFGFVYGSYAVSELIAGRTGFLDDLPLDLPAVLLIALLAQGLYPVARLTRDWDTARRWLAIFGAVVTIAAVQSLLNLVENRLLGVIPAFSVEQLPLIRRHYARHFLSHIYMCFANAAVLVFLIEARQGERQRLKLAQAEAAEANARAQALRLQLNPHFLFNTINSVSSLVVTRRADEAEHMLERLADFLRLSLDADPDALVRLDEEFDTAHSYLEIEAVRFGERMVVELDCPPELAGVRVPSFILQPLVENAVKYGVARSSRTVTVRVVAARDAQTVRLCVSDDHDGSNISRMPHQGFGIGLANIRERLAARYGAAARLSTERDGTGFKAVVSVPFSET